MAKTTFGEETAIESGTVVMWAGLLADIPSGWALCDGNNGTPDLTGKFLKGHPNASEIPGTVGGADSVTLSTSQLPAHTHTGSTSTDGSHTHEYYYNDFDGGGTGSDNASTIYQNVDVLRTSTYNGAHSHTVTYGTTGGDGSITNVPPYYEVAFIQKL